jgi:hypothetical protein
MSTITFDTQKYADTLLAGGVPPEQVKAFVNGQRGIIADVAESTLATRADLASLEKALHADITRIERKLVEHDGEFQTIKWMMSTIIAIAVAVAIKSFFPGMHL